MTKVESTWTDGRVTVANFSRWNEANRHAGNMRRVGNVSHVFVERVQKVRQAAEQDGLVAALKAIAAATGAEVRI